MTMPRARDIVLGNLREKTGCVSCSLEARDAGSLIAFYHNGRRYSVTPSMKPENVIPWVIERIRAEHV